MSSYDPFTDDSAHVSVGHVQMRIGYIAYCLGIPAATLSDLRSGEMVAVPREPTPDFWPSYCTANGAMPGSAWDTLSQKLYRAIIKHQIAAAKDARHG